MVTALSAPTSAVAACAEQFAQRSIQHFVPPTVSHVHKNGPVKEEHDLGSNLFSFLDSQKQLFP